MKDEGGRMKGAGARDTKARRQEGKKQSVDTRFVGVARLVLHPSSFILLFLIGCQPYGGAIQVAPERLNTIDSLNLAPAAATQPTTEPTTQPATEPAAEVTLTLEDVRQMA